MPDLRLSLREMCERFGVTPRTLRYYEYIELLAPARVGRSRFYGPREAARMTLILRGRRFGFSLEEIRQWLKLYDDEGLGPQLAVFVQYANRQLANLRDQRDELTATITDLVRLRDEAARSLRESEADNRPVQARAG